MKAITQQYRPSEHETAVYRQWEKSGAFTPPPGAPEPFVIMLPPPNITGSLHLGHALQDTIMDILVRWRRMQGRPTLWLPGTDHAAIATNRVLEAQLRHEGTSRLAIGRAQYLKRAATWYREVGDTIVRQIKRLGCSCDWSRYRFTMDEAYVRAVQEAFVRYFKRGYIYRGNRLVNWCPHCASVVSDLEVVYQEADAELITVRYPLRDRQTFIAVATTRPETMLGDTAVAIHPEDARYRAFIGRTVVLPLVGREIPVIADARVDPSYGTGAVKITPAHDPLDAAIGATHHLPAIKVIGEDGRLTDAAGQYAGLPVAKARRAVLEALNEAGLVSERQTMKHRLTRCDRCGHTIEPLLSRQWFVAMDKLKEAAATAAAAGLVKFVPGRWQKHFLTWLGDVHDWTISRQLWLGQAIPAWWKPGKRGTDNEDDNFIVALDKPAGTWEADPDTLDTWFSSAIWPLATLGWPAKTPDLARFYPTSVLVTARDILYLWVARMVFSGLELMQGEGFGDRPATERIPFREVFIHPTVLTKTGQRMSKSLGTGIDPLELIDKYGADATRFGLMFQMSFDNQAIRYDEAAIKAARNFTNKVWHLGQLFEKLTSTEHRETPATLADRWIEQRFNSALASIDTLLTQYKIGEAARHLHEFIWRDLADWYVEVLKVEGSRAVAQDVWHRTLRLAHPFLPHLTEVLYGRDETDLLIMGPWPTPRMRRDDPKVTNAFAHFQDIVTVVRQARTLFGVPPAAFVTIAYGNPPLPAALAVLCRARLISTAAKAMLRVPLADGSTIALHAEQITAASITRAEQKLAVSERKLQQNVLHLEQSLAAMRPHAPSTAITAKTKALAAARAQLQNLLQIKKLL